MAEITPSGTDVYTVALDADEGTLLDKHKELWGMDAPAALNDLLEFALASVHDEKGPDDTAPLFDDEEGVSCVDMSVRWIPTGKWKLLDDTDKRFVDNTIMLALREALRIVVYCHARERGTDGLERQG